MTVLALAVIPSVARYRLTTELDAVNYVLDFRWNTRAEAWFVDVLREDESPIHTSIKLMLGTLLAFEERGEDFPPGDFLVEDSSREGIDATLDDLGVRVFLYYFSEDEP